MKSAARTCVLTAAFVLSANAVALAQSCPEPLASARRLILVTTDGFATPHATAQTFSRAFPQQAWKAASAPEAAQVGRTGIAWSYFFRNAAKPGEPIKVEGDRRAPAGFFRVSRSFGLIPLMRPNYTRLVEGTTCVHDVSSADYNTITNRSSVGMSVRGENMWRVPEYKRGLFVDYPTNALARAGSCIFIHMTSSQRTGTGGCVALPEARVAALQDFAEPGAVLAILPKAALPRFGSCLPSN